MTAWLEGHPGLPRLLAGMHPDPEPMTMAEHERVHGPRARNRFARADCRGR